MNIILLFKEPEPGAGAGAGFEICLEPEPEPENQKRTGSGNADCKSTSGRVRGLVMEPRTNQDGTTVKVGEIIDLVTSIQHGSSEKEGWGSRFGVSV